MFTNNLIAGASGQGGFYPYQIEQSLRFNDDDSAYLSRTPASAGNRKTWTWSGWVKRGNIGGARRLMTAGSSVTDPIGFLGGDTFQVQSDTSGYNLITTQVFRDTSAWYHFVVALDTTQATSSDRLKIYVNGSQITSFGTSTYPSLNSDSDINNAVIHNIGRRAQTASEYVDGYLAEVNFIDGQALAASDFGETKSGIWVPKAYSGSYGTNGFYLNFSDSAAIGDDLSGNGNDWTANNLVSTDVLLDSPTNNFAVYNNLAFAGSAGLLAEGNLAYRDATGAASWKSRWATMAPTSGKWYAEFRVTFSGSGSLGGAAAAGLHDGLAATTFLGQSAGSYGYFADALKRNNGVTTAYGATYGNGDYIGVAWDADAGELTFYKNGVSQGVAYTGIDAENKYFGISTFWVTPDGTTWWYANFGQSPFAYTPPSGFLPLNTANLPAPAIDPAVDDVPADYFNTVLYTGTGAVRSVTGVGFQPDWVWFKRRGAVENHWLTDAVRGSTKGLFSNLTDAEATRTDQLTSFDADGFSLGADAAGYTNVSGQSYVAWSWLAGNGTSSNTDGSITSTVSVNQKAGFSVVSYGGTGTVGHGLIKAPELVICKNRGVGGTSWSVNGSFGPLIYGTNKLLLESTGGLAADTNEVTAATSTTFTTGGSSATSGLSQIAYCFHSVEGYSKFGSYTGNGSTDGPFVYCGFRPAWVMVKNASIGTEGWRIWDAVRGNINVVDETLEAHTSGAEFASASLDFVSNGFKIRNTSSPYNGSGNTHIFMAFAEAPFKYSNAR